MKICVSTYSFHQLLGQGKIKQPNCIELAKTMGFDAVELAGLQCDENEIPEYAALIKKESVRVGIPVKCMTVHADFLNGCGGDTKAEIERVKSLVDAGRIIGLEMIRHDAAWQNPKPFNKVIPVLADAVRKVSEYAEKCGIKTMVENHGYFCQGTERMAKLYEAVDHKNFGLLLDMGNFTFADEAPEISFSKLAPYAFHIHAKDMYVRSASAPCPGRGFSWKSQSGKYIRGAIIGHGEVDILHCLQALKKAEYTGDITIEYEGIENCEEGIAIGLENLKLYLETAGFEVS